MLNKHAKPKTKLEMEIDTVTTKLGTYDPFSKEYTAMSKNLEVLYRMQNGIPSRRPSPDTLAQIGGSLLGLVVIRSWEQFEVLPKALNFVIRGKI